MRATIWGWVARKLAEGRAGPGRSHTRASEAGKRRPLETVAWAGDTGRRCTGTRQRARLTREPPGLGADGRANATSDICAVSLTLGWRGQEESEFCPGDPMASGSTAVPFPCEGWGAEAVSSLLSHGSPSPCISNMSLRGPQHYPPSSLLLCQTQKVSESFGCK